VPFCPVSFFFQVLFVNGRVHQVMSNVSASWLPSNLLLGMDGAQYMAGQIDEVQIWNAAVNVSVFYDKYLRGTEEGLVRYYKCNEGEGKQFKDSSTSKKPGSLHGTTWLSSSLELRKLN